MNELQLFKYQDKEVRTVTLNGEPWFIAKDVCEVFGETNRNRAMQALDDDEKGYTQTDTPGGVQRIAIVSEAGLYNLLFAMRPTKARGISDEYVSEREQKLKDFKRWVTHDVLPTIRRHGAYMTPETLDRMIASPEFGIKLLTALKEEREKNAIMAPKAEYFDALVDRNLLTNFRDTAKELKTGVKEFVNFLLDNKYIFRDKKGCLLPYEAKNRGLFEVKEYVSDNWTGLQTLITPKGRETFRLLLKGARA